MIKMPCLAQKKVHIYKWLLGREVTSKDGTAKSEWHKKGQLKLMRLDIKSPDSLPQLTEWNKKREEERKSPLPLPYLSSPILPPCATLRPCNLPVGLPLLCPIDPKSKSSMLMISCLKSHLNNVSCSPVGADGASLLFEGVRKELQRRRAGMGTRPCLCLSKL